MGVILYGPEERSLLFFAALPGERSSSDVSARTAYDVFGSRNDESLKFKTKSVGRRRDRGRNRTDDRRVATPPESRSSSGDGSLCRSVDHVFGNVTCLSDMINLNLPYTYNGYRKSQRTVRLVAPRLVR